MKHSHEKRKHERKSVSRSVSISVLGSIAEEDEIVGQPEKGYLLRSGDRMIRLSTDQHLSPGKLVKIDEPGQQRAGVVMWVVNSEDECCVELLLL